MISFNELKTAFPKIGGSKFPMLSIPIIIPESISISQKNIKIQIITMTKHIKLMK